ncbi:MAG: class E sortase [Actinomycetota bacterium]|nr:class E sortase [Actinomycetota bacterium]
MVEVSTGHSPSRPLAGDRRTPAPHSPLGTIRRTVRELGLGLITAGVVILLFVTYQLWGTSIAEANSQAALKRSFDQHLAVTPPTPVSPSPTATSAPTTGGDNPAVGNPLPTTPGGGAIDHLLIPKIGVDKFVVQGVGEEDLRRGPGHYPQTAMPGEQGNAAIAGHRTTYGAPFYRLNELGPGDDILLTNSTGKTFRYQVTQTMVVAPSDVMVLNPTPDARLTLTTCNPRFSASTRLIVVAKLIGLPAPPPPPTAAPVVSQPNVTPRAATLDTLGHGNGGAWPPAIAYGAAVVVIWIMTRILINRTRRLRRVGAYVGGIALCLIPLWFCFENVVLLLPQSI